MNLGETQERGCLARRVSRGLRFFQIFLRMCGDFLGGYRLAADAPVSVLDLLDGHEGHVPQPRVNFLNGIGEFGYQLTFWSVCKAPSTSFTLMIGMV